MRCLCLISLVVRSDAGGRLTNVITQVERTDGFCYKLHVRITHTGPLNSRGMTTILELDTHCIPMEHLPMEYQNHPLMYHSHHTVSLKECECHTSSNATQPKT